jgi:hypothetical protein
MGFEVVGSVGSWKLGVGSWNPTWIGPLDALPSGDGMEKENLEMRNNE